MLKMKHAVWILSLSLLAVSGLRGAQREEKVFKITGTPSVSVRNISGRIHVRTWSRAEVEVIADKSSSQMVVEMDQVGNTVRIEAKSTRRGEGFFRSRESVDFAIQMPAEGNLDANSISGDVSVEDLKGDLEVESVSGDLDLRRLGRRLRAHSVSGEIELSEGQIDVELSTVSGDIHVSDVTGRLDVESVSGSIRIERSEAPRMHVSTVSGDIDSDTLLRAGGTYRLSSHSGTISIFVARNASFELSAQTFSGEIESGLPLRVTTPESRRSHRRSVRGTYGSGGSKIDLVTFSGDIRIVSR